MLTPPLHVTEVDLLVSLFPSSACFFFLSCSSSSSFASTLSLLLLLLLISPLLNKPSGRSPVLRDSPSFFPLFFRFHLPCLPSSIRHGRRLTLHPTLPYPSKDPSSPFYLYLSFVLFLPLPPPPSSHRHRSIPLDPAAAIAWDFCFHHYVGHPGGRSSIRCNLTCHHPQAHHSQRDSARPG